MQQNNGQQPGGTAGLFGKLKEYSESDFYPFHMPGHKRREIADFFKVPNPYSIDITEIDGFDNLHHAEGILKESMEQAAEIYGADKSYYLVNGSTCGILSAIFGCTKSGGKILVSRNCHKAAYHGMVLNRLEAEYLYPEYLDEYGINGGIRVGDVRAALEKNREDLCESERNDGDGKNAEKIQAVLIVSPTYEGIVSDIRAIADTAHEYGVPLIVDEAHGAHLPFAHGGVSGRSRSMFPESALYRGADVVIQSLHKTLPSLTQTAILHVKSEMVDIVRLERYLGMFQSSSPSYLFMAAMERCIRFMDGEGREEMKLYEARMNCVFKELGTLKVLRVLDRDVCREMSVYDWDMSKVVISVKQALKGIPGFSGETLGEMLRNDYHLEMEMAAPEYVIAMTSVMDTDEGLRRLVDALKEIDWKLALETAAAGRKGFGDVVENGHGNRYEMPRAVPVLTLTEAMDQKGVPTALGNSVNKISQEFVYLYPPGIPILAPGERITEEILERILWYQKMGFSVQGLSDMSVSSIITVAEES